MKEANQVYEEYKKMMSSYSDKIDYNSAMRTPRKGLPGLRDRIVNFRLYWNETQSYYSLAQAIVLLTALVPMALVNANGMFEYLGLDFRIPVAFTSIFILFAGVSFIVFGFLAYRKLRLVKRNMETSGLLSPSTFMVMDYLIRMEQKIDKTQKELEELKNDVHRHPRK